MKEWNIKDYDGEEINWQEVPSLTIDEYPWYENGLKQETNVKIAVANDTIHIYAKAKDKHIRARAEKLNDPVHEDSCFEFFVTPWNERSKSYFNIEVNCMGILYMAYKNDQGESKLISEEQFKLMGIESSLKDIKAIDKETGWELTVTVPIALLEEISGKEIKKDIWYGNFYRCGGEEDDQYATWNPLEFDIPNYHLPMQFGKLIIKSV